MRAGENVIQAVAPNRLDISEALEAGGRGKYESDHPGRQAPSMIEHAEEDRRVFIRPVLRCEELRTVVEELAEHFPLDVTGELGFGRVRWERVHAEWL